MMLLGFSILSCNNNNPDNRISPDTSNESSNVIKMVNEHINAMETKNMQLFFQFSDDAVFSHLLKF